MSLLSQIEDILEQAMLDKLVPGYQTSLPVTLQYKGSGYDPVTETETPGATVEKPAIVRAATVEDLKHTTANQMNLADNIAQGGAITVILLAKYFPGKTERDIQGALLTSTFGLHRLESVTPKLISGTRVLYFCIGARL
jgi:hypothetical protein